MKKSLAVSVVLLVLIAVFGFAYYSQSTQVSSLNTQVQSLNSEVQTLQSGVSSASSQAATWQSVAEGGFALGKSVVLANKLSLSSNCTGPHFGYGGQIVAFQANYSGYLVVTSSDFTNNSKAFPFLMLDSYPSFPAGNIVGPPETHGFYLMNGYSSHPLQETMILPVSPPGYFTLSLTPVPPLGFCVTGANASGTFSVTYYY